MIKIKINKLTYTIEFVATTSVENTLGTCESSAGKIQVLNSLSKEQTRQTLIHELTHAYLWAYGFFEWAGSEEAMCDFIGTYADDIVKHADYILREKEKNKNDKARISSIFN